MQPAAPGHKQNKVKLSPHTHIHTNTLQSVASETHDTEREREREREREGDKDTAEGPMLIRPCATFLVMTRTGPLL